MLVINFIPYLSLGTSHKLGNHSAEGKRGGDHQSHSPVSERGHRVQFTDELGATLTGATVALSDSADAQIVCPQPAEAIGSEAGRRVIGTAALPAVSARITGLTNEPAHIHYP